MLKNFLSLALIVFLIGFSHPFFSNASDIEDLKNQIKDRNSNISKLEKEIAEYQNQIEKVGSEKKSLSNEIYRLNLNRKKLSKSIELTNQKINATKNNLKKLSEGISEKEEKMEGNKKALSETIRLTRESDDNSLVEILLSTNDISDFWNDFEELQQFQVGIREKTNELQKIKKDLEKNKKETEKEKKELYSLKNDLSDQKQIIELNKKEKYNLLKRTKNKESEYKKILAEKQALKESFESEIADLESQLKIKINPNSIPETGYGIISWPLNKVYITQYFGNTPFSTKNAQVYGGHGHNGVDFRASPGTKIKAVSGGIVKGTGNTDTVPPKCYSYGKWILIEHDNGLSSLYAHLSLIKVVPGQRVNKGETIAYSGNTGYSTGPHLHLGIYASSGVKIQKFTKSINCKNKYVPIAPYNAYLNPLSYLPKYK